MRPPFAARRSTTVSLGLGLAYAALIVYASLFPLDWQAPAHWSNPLLHPWPQGDSRSDLLVNVLAYLPLGMLLALAWRRLGRLPAALLALAAGFSLSFCMELLQEALPGRVSSASDIALNTAGTLAGLALAQCLAPDSLSGAWLRAWRERHVRPSPAANLLLLTLAVWAAAELFPGVPSPDLGTIKHGLRPLVETLLHPASFGGWRALGDVGELLGIGLLARRLLREPAWPWAAGLLLGVALLKIVVVRQVLSLEYFTATLLALALLALCGRPRPRWSAGLALAAIVLSLLVDELRRGVSDRLLAFNWMPFAAQIGTLPGFEGLLTTLWIALGLAAATRLMLPEAPGWQRWGGVFGGLALFALWLALEWHQQRVPGRVPDISDPLVALAGWSLAWWAQARVTR